MNTDKIDTCIVCAQGDCCCTPKNQWRKVARAHPEKPQAMPERVCAARDKFEKMADNSGYDTRRYDEDEDPAYYITASTQTMWTFFCEGIAYGEGIPHPQPDEAKPALSEEQAVEALAQDICDTVNKLNGEAYTYQQWMGSARKALALLPHLAPDKGLVEALEMLERVEGKQIAIWSNPYENPREGGYVTWNDGEYWVSKATKLLRAALAKGGN